MLVNLQVTLFVLLTWFLYRTFCQEKPIQNARVFTTFLIPFDFRRDEKYYASSSTAAAVLVASAEANSPPLSAKVDNQSLLGPVGP